MLCYEYLTGRYFESNISELKSVENKLNDLLFKIRYVTINDVLNALGLTASNDNIMNYLGWVLENGKFEFELEATIAEDGGPVLCVDYAALPEFLIYKNRKEK